MVSTDNDFCRGWFEMIDDRGVTHMLLKDTVLYMSNRGNLTEVQGQMTVKETFVVEGGLQVKDKQDGERSLLHGQQGGAGTRVEHVQAGSGGDVEIKAGQGGVAETDVVGMHIHMLCWTLPSCPCFVPNSLPS